MPTGIGLKLGMALTSVSAGPSVPGNAMLWPDGTPMLWPDGAYMLWPS